MSAIPAPSHSTLMTRPRAGYATEGISPAQGTCSEGSHFSGVLEGKERDAELLRSSWCSCAFSVDTWRREGPSGSGPSCLQRTGVGGALRERGPCHLSPEGWKAPVSLLPLTAVRCLCSGILIPQEAGPCEAPLPSIVPQSKTPVSAPSPAVTELSRVLVL